MYHRLALQSRVPRIPRLASFVLGLSPLMARTTTMGYTITHGSRLFVGSRHFLPAHAHITGHTVHLVRSYCLDPTSLLVRSQLSGLANSTAPTIASGLVVVPGRALTTGHVLTTARSFVTGHTYNLARARQSGSRTLNGYLGTGPSTIASNRSFPNLFLILLHAPSAMATVPLLSPGTS